MHAARHERWTSSFSNYSEEGNTRSVFARGPHCIIHTSICIEPRDSLPLLMSDVAGPCEKTLRSEIGPLYEETLYSNQVTVEVLSTFAKQANTLPIKHIIAKVLSVWRAAASLSNAKILVTVDLLKPGRHLVAAVESIEHLLARATGEKRMTFPVEFVLDEHGAIKEAGGEAGRGEAFFLFHGRRLLYHFSSIPRENLAECLRERGFGLEASE